MSGGGPPPRRRQDPRYDVDVRVDWSTGRMFVTDHATNLSRNGVCIQSGTAIPQDAEVTMVLWLPGRRPIRAVGHVVWSHEIVSAAPPQVSGSGVSLVEMHPADRALLHEYLGELASGAPPARGH
jgi:uncharacterized protein (TIGR02266 family)